MAFTENTIIDYTADIVYAAMAWANPSYWLLWAGIVFIAGLISMAPWKLAPEHDSLDVVAHATRRVLLWLSIALLAGAGVIYWFFDMAWRGRMANHLGLFSDWLWNSLLHYGWMVPVAGIAGLALRFYYFRFIHPWVSSVLRDWRNLQVQETESDIRAERSRYNAKDFLPHQFYDKNHRKLLVGLDVTGKPIYIPAETWLETNMQVIGPTRYGKGVAMGCLMDQIVRRGDTLIYIDPKSDKWAPRVMLQAAIETKRPFVYVTLHDGGIGYWSPFEGGSRRDAYSRLITIFGMVEQGGDSDFYKVLEKMQLNRIISRDDSYDLETLYGKIKGANAAARDPRDKALKIEALLENWRQIKSLNPPPELKGEQFSVERALLENAVVYIQGSLNDDVVKVASKAMIMEIIQEAMRLQHQRAHHLTLIIDEVRFLVSKQLADALATAVGFRVNIVTAYQSINDLRTPDDINLDGETILQAVNVNSQLKLIYGGADVETAEWVAKLSGTITKEVTSMERTTVRTAGAEEWERGRTIKHHEEALIPENVVLTLPPRVAVLFQPRSLATPAFTAPVPVKKEDQLQGWLDERQHLRPDHQSPGAAKLEHAQVATPAIPAAPRRKKATEGKATPATPSLSPAPKSEVTQPTLPEPYLEHAQEPVPAPGAINPIPSPVPAGKGKFELEALVACGLDNLDFEELKWIFNNTGRQQRLAELVDEESLKKARARYYQAKGAMRGTVIKPEQPKDKEDFFYGEDTEDDPQPIS